MVERILRDARGLTPAQTVERTLSRLALTPQQLGQRLGVHARTVSRWLAGLSQVHPIYLERMADLQPMKLPQETVPHATTEAPGQE
jgi:transcriptional regulator with XRE-family HTH domain